MSAPVYVRRIGSVVLWPHHFESTLKQEACLCRHQHEKMLMWQRAEEQRKKDSEEYQIKLKKACISHASLLL